jgi:probable F420-dependent oxidoreductase
VAVTTKLELCTGVVILPEHNPVLLAKQAATLDALSGGRLSLGVGLGWLKEEYDAMGMPWDRRGKRATESIEAMRALWTQEPASYEGDTVSFERVRCNPKPMREGGVKIIVGGHSEPAARRAGRLGDGFLPLGFRGNDPKPLIDVMKRAASNAGRDPEAIELSAGFGGNFGHESADEVRTLADQGFSHVFFFINGTTPDRARRALEDIATRVIEPYRSQSR